MARETQAIIGVRPPSEVAVRAAMGGRLSNISATPTLCGVPPTRVWLDGVARDSPIQQRRASGDGLRTPKRGTNPGGHRAQTGGLRRRRPPREKKDLSRRPRSGRSSSIGSGLPSRHGSPTQSLPRCARSRAGTQSIRLFDRVLEARDGLVASLPPDGQTPRTRVGGQAILFSMKRLMDNMDAFEGFASTSAVCCRAGSGMK